MLYYSISGGSEDPRPWPRGRPAGQTRRRA
jgi:hypothetical protein